MTEPKEIATLPPLDVIESTIPLSEATGQPRRLPLMVVGACFLYAAATAALLSAGVAWWQSMDMALFPTATKLIELTQPRPGGWRSVAWVSALALLSVVLVATPAISGFNAWNGHRWSRIAALVSIPVAALGWFFNPIAWAGVPLAAIGAAILWTRPVDRYFSHWAEFRAGAIVEPAPAPPVLYGPLPRYR
ncbi:MAG TPA: hypothetical protein VLR88_03000 [Propionibacteriaceae bacterium]|nr:hypothetical protein [Propionibacteriaceae bacterium]